MIPVHPTKNMRKSGGVTFKTEVSISGDLDDSELPFFCDVVNYHTINHPPFKEHIDTEGVTFYQREVTAKR